MSSGFYKAPVTKLVLAACASLTLLGHLGGFIDRLAIERASHVFAGAQRWRLFTSLLPSESLAEGAVSWVLLYRFRTFERQMGSARFSLFAALVGIWAVASRAGALALVSPLAGTGVASGPYELIFALFVYYYSKVPKLQPNYATVLGFRVSDKTLTYVMGLQLLLSGGLRSAVPAAAGLAFGALFLGCGGGRALAWPAALRRCCRRWVAPFLDAPPTPGGAARGAAGGAGDGDDNAGAGAPPGTARRRARRDAGGAPQPARAGAADGADAGAADALPTPAPDEAALERLVAMGFDRDRAAAALRRAFNDESAAVEWLLR